MIRLTVDEKEIEVEEGTNLLQACLKNGIYVPHLCYLGGMANPPASCRLCFIEIAGVNHPTPSCRTAAEAGMVVSTATPAVRHLQRSALQLLLSAHRVDCRNCPANKRCDLQKMAKFLGVPLKVKHLDSLVDEVDADLGHPVLKYDPGRCVLCGKCIYICREQQGHPLLTFARRGFETVIGFMGNNDSAELPCFDCLACIEICPVSAIYLKSTIEFQSLPSGNSDLRAVVR
ncbi:MAG: 2Fe-2S iron-sulfur cluster-binding protein [Desulforhabdus sp.]|jgi:NADH dehydrogenase/NADH:ubiquinone oxidoreductase subunit G|nr:2Fe-2S iron-sulfur cluster-binding protein [Desulforhabdus sp.]